MPKPIICLADVLSQFAELFRPCFSNRQFKYFVTVLLALLECQECRTELQAQHRRNLLEWLEQQFRQGVDSNFLATYLGL